MSFRSKLSFSWVFILSFVLSTNGFARQRAIGGNLGFRQAIFDPSKPYDRVETTIAGGPADEEGVLLKMITEVVGTPERETQICDALFNGIDQILREKENLGAYRNLNRLGDGCETGNAWEMSADVNGEVLALRYVAQEYLLTFHTTTPSGISRSDDPRFRLTYDISIDIDLKVPRDLRAAASNPEIIQVREAKVKITNASLKFVEGEAGTLFKGIVDGFARALVTQANSRLNSALGAHSQNISSLVREALAPRNVMLSNAVAFARFDTLSARVVPDAIVGSTKGTVLIIIEKVYAATPTGPGRINGVVTWNRADGVYADGGPCDSLQVIVFSPRRLYEPGQFHYEEAPTGALTSLTEVTDLPPGKLGCEFEVHNLPLNISLRPEVTSRLAFRWQSDTLPVGSLSSLYATPVGFSGTVVLTDEPTVIRGGTRGRRPEISAPGQRRVELSLQFKQKPR